MNKDGERIAKLEQHMIDQDQKLDDLNKKFDKVGDKIQEIINTLQAQANLVIEISTLKTELSSVNLKIERIKSERLFWRWFAPILTAAVVTIVAPILTLLILSYLNKLK